MGQPKEDRELLDLFLEETRERLDALEPALVELERVEGAARAARLDEVLRHFHSTKGSAGYLELHDLVRVLHSAEQIVVSLRDGRETRSEHVDLLLQAASALRGYLACLGTGENPPDVEGLAARLDLLARGGGGDSPLPEPRGRPNGSQSAPESPPDTAPDVSVRRQPPADARPNCHCESQAAAENAGGGDEAIPIPSPDQHPLNSDLLPRDGHENQNGAGDAGLFGSTVRIPVRVVEQLGRLAEEMLVTRNRVTSMAAAFQDHDLTGAAQKLSVTVSELQDIAALTRLQPVAFLFSQAPRVARDSARASGKEVEVVLEGGTLEVDRRILQELRDPLVHLIRNAVDHGVEAPADRVRQGKPSTGQVRIRATRAGANLVLEVGDDGAGIDYEVVKAKGIERGLMTAREAATWSESDFVGLLLRPGFSTRDNATAVSGRGVGLDVVATRMQELGGSLNVQSVRGQGTTIRLTVPTAVSVVRALVFDARGYLLGLPHSCVHEILSIVPQQVERYGVQEVLRLRGRLVPLFGLDAWPDRRPAAGRTGQQHVVVLGNGVESAGLLCDAITRYEELIVKPAGNMVRGVETVSGLASLGTGETVLILDADKLLADVGLTLGAEAEPRGDERFTPSTPTAEGERETFILFRAGAAGRYAVPVSQVSRITRYGPAECVVVGQHAYLRQSGDLIPLVSVVGDSLPGAGGGRGIALVSSGEIQGALAATDVVRVCERAATARLGLQTSTAGLLNLEDGVYELVDIPTTLGGRVAGGVAAAPSGGPSGRRRALLVEEDPDLREALIGALRACGLEVLQCSTAESGLALLRPPLTVDLIVTDYLLPGQSGLDLLRAIRSGAAGLRHDTPVLVFSQQLANIPDAPDRLRTAGADEIVSLSQQTIEEDLLGPVSRLLQRWAQPAGDVGGAESAEPEEICHVLAVEIGQRVCGLPVAHVKEMTTLDRLTPTPVTRSGFLGLANIRGEILPVFDLAGVLEEAQQTEGQRPVDVVLITGLGPLVLRCDGIRGTLKIAPHDMGDPRGRLGTAAGLVTAVAAMRDCLVEVLDIDRLGSRCLGWQ